MKNNIKKIITLTGSYLGILIGSGAASGQEIMQYFVPQGLFMFPMAAVLIASLFITNFGCAYVGHNKLVNKGSELLTFFCGKVIGKIFDIYFIAFYFMCFIMMTAGAAATLNQQYDIPTYIGIIIICSLVVITVLSGLKKLVDIIGSVTPLLVGVILIILIISLISNVNQIPANIESINNKTLETMSINDNWFLSAASYSGGCVCLVASFSTSLSLKDSGKQIHIANLLSAIIYALLCVIMALSILSNFTLSSGSQIPNLIIAASVWEPLGHIFGFLIFVAIYTTTTPLLWTCIDRFAKEKTKKSYLLTIFATIIGALIAAFIPFDVLVHYVFMINGYIGFAVSVVIGIRIFIIKFKSR